MDFFLLLYLLTLCLRIFYTMNVGEIAVDWKIFGLNVYRFCKSSQKFKHLK